MVQNFPTTTSYNYGNNDKEFVLCSRGRPFVTLISPNSPTPTSTLIDFNLVKDLALKISDLQCKKFYFGGEQLRVLGTISTTVQCIQDGFVCGSFQFRANVIEDLKQHFGVHSIAGVKLSKMLQPSSAKTNGDNCTSSGAPTPASKSLPSTPRKSPTNRSSSPSTPRTPTRTVSPPPGFEFAHPQPVHPCGYNSVQLYARTCGYSPLQANWDQLDEMFNGADLQDTVEDELRALRGCDEDGWQETSFDRFTFRLSSLHDYQTGHGRNKCSRQRCILEGVNRVPHNCGWHSDWYLPDSFIYCDPLLCRGAFCKCLMNYNVDFNS